MKKIFLALVIAVCATATSAQSKFFEACEQLDGVSTVYISKAMLEFAGMSDIDCDNVNISAFASKLDGVEIINAEKASRKRVKELASTLVKEKNCQNLMRVKDGVETVNMYFNELPRQRTEFIIISDEPVEFSIIILTGTMTMKEVVKTVKNN